MENTKDKCKKWNQVDVYFNAMEMFKEDKSTIDMLLQKYLSGEFQEYVKLPVPLILLESKLNISTEEAMEDIMKKYPYADPNLFICTPSTKDMDKSKGVEINKESSQETDVISEESCDMPELKDEMDAVEAKSRMILVQAYEQNNSVGFVFKTNAPHNVLASCCNWILEMYQNGRARTFEDHVICSILWYMNIEGYTAKFVAETSNYSEVDIVLNLGIQDEDVYPLYCHSRTPRNGISEELSPEKYSDYTLRQEDFNNYKRAITADVLEESQASQHVSHTIATLAGLPVIAYLKRNSCESSSLISCTLDEKDLDTLIDLIL